MMTRYTPTLALASSLLLLACSDDPDVNVPAGVDATADGASVDAGAVDDADVSADTQTGVDADTTDDASLDAGAAETTDTGGTPGDLLVECEELAYEVTCDDTAVRTGGYYACSDYFGDTTGVEVQCSASPTTDVRVGGPPCAGYEHFVGSCVYFTDALPDRCYITHVGAERADLVEAGREFWRTACAGEWLE